MELIDESISCVLIITENDKSKTDRAQEVNIKCKLIFSTNEIPKYIMSNNMSLFK